MTQRNYQAKLEFDASAFNPADHAPSSGSLGWSCPSNIAIVKYWGKREVQIPMNPSLSMTLSEALTTTQIDYQFNPGIKAPSLDFLFDGKKSPDFEHRIRSFLSRIVSYLPVVKHTNLQIDSTNTFPHSSGIASSASALGALALCLVELQTEIKGSVDHSAMMKNASFIARLGSGSAARSIFPRFSLWGSSEEVPGSSDEFAIPVTGFHDSFRKVRDTIMIVDSEQKKVSSSTGHDLMKTNPFSDARFSQAVHNLGRLKKMLTDGNWEGFIEVMEEEALSLHAMMMTGRPGYLLMQPGTLAIIQKVREFRKDTGRKVGFTLDAGANVHILYAHEDARRVDEFITNELIPYCEDGRMIRDRMGNGPVKKEL